MTMRTIMFLAVFATSAIADTPASIIADYRSKADAALAKVNDTLEKATVPIISELVKAGDTAGAEEVKEQLKAKQACEPVPKPHAKAHNLFKLYDAARAKALEPARSAATARIEAMLKSSDGKNLETVTELGNIREEIETGIKPPELPKIPVDWTYHSSLEQKVPMATVKFHPDGAFEMSGTQPGKWKANRKGDEIRITFRDRSEWQITLDPSGQSATIQRPDISGNRFLKLATKTAP